MKSPRILYTPDQQKAIALLEKQPLTRDELLEYFPSRNKRSLAAMLRTPTQTGKVFINPSGKYQLFHGNESGMTVIQGRPMPYSSPPKREFLYDTGTLPRDY